MANRRSVSLDPPVVDIAQGSGPLREQRSGGDGHRGVRDMVRIHIDRLELAVGAGDEIVAPGDGGAHFLQYVGETDVALYAVAADTGDFTVPPLMAPAARKYEAEASPSTR